MGIGGYLTERHGEVVCNTVIRSEEKGELYDASLHSESTTGGKQVAFVPGPFSLGRRGLHLDLCPRKSGRGSRMPGRRRWWHDPRYADMEGCHFRYSATHHHRGAGYLWQTSTVSSARGCTIHEK